DKDKDKDKDKGKDKGKDKVALHSSASVDDDERRLNADRLVERLTMFADCLNGFGDESNVNYGHWLDDSRLINSYNLEPHDLLELQLRDHYIQLPPPGGHLNYADHYAEGVLFKLSKKSRPVSILTNQGGKDSTGVWKERWVVLQGNRLLIYHKRKDTAKKTVQLPTPLHMITRVLPPHSRQQSKFTMSSAATMSATLIALDTSSDPNSPKLCFRGSSENELGHWVRIFASLNTVDPLRSPVFDRDSSVLARQPDLGSDTMVNNTSGFSAERKRNHTSQSIGTNSTTINFISPTLISNAMAAFSNLNGNHSTTHSGQGYINSNDYHRSLSKDGSLQTTADRKDASSLLHHPLITHGKEDSRRRAITEPHLMIPNQSRHYGTHAIKGSLPGAENGAQLQRSVDVSNVSEAPFRLDSPPGKKRRPVLGTEYLDNASQVLLATSSTRSSIAPLYSGYIWLYLPPGWSKATVTSTGGDAIVGSQIFQTANESGQYVKCFAAINDHGHFQWVEVKKQMDIELEQDSKSEAALGSSTTPSRSSYGFQLRPGTKTGTLESRQLSPPPPSDASDKQADHIGNRSVDRLNSRAVHATMAHKLRLFFFCIRISREALGHVLLDMENSPTRSPTSPGTPSPPSIKSRHRVSSSISVLGSSALPPLPTMKPQSLSGSISKGMMKNSTSVSPVQSQTHQHHSYDLPPLGNGYGSSLFPEQPLTTSPEQHSRPISHKRSATSLKSTNDGRGSDTSPGSSADKGSSSSEVLIRAQILQKAAALTRQLSISNAGDDNSTSSGQPLTSSSSPNPTSNARLSLGETVSAKKSNIPDSASTFESSRVLHDRPAPSTRHLLNSTRENENDADMMLKCPFLEASHDSEEDGHEFVMLKGYTETEEGWRILQSTLERFIDPIQDQLSALPPEDTLIPSYTLLPSPETRLSEKAEIYLSAKATLLEEANLQASLAAAAIATSVSESLEQRSPTPDHVTVSSTHFGPTTHFKGTTVLHRLMNLSGGGDRDKSKNSSSTPLVPDHHTYRQAQFMDDGGSSGLSNSSPHSQTSTGVAIKRGISPGSALSQTVGTATHFFRPRPRLNQQRSADELTKMAGYYGHNESNDAKNGGMYSTLTASALNGGNGETSGNGHSLHPRHYLPPQVRPGVKYCLNCDEKEYSRLEDGSVSQHHHIHHCLASPSTNGATARSMSLTAASSSHYAHTMAMLSDETPDRSTAPKRTSRSSLYSLHSPVTSHCGHDAVQGCRVIASIDNVTDDEGDIKGGIVAGILDLENVRSSNDMNGHDRSDRARQARNSDRLHSNGTSPPTSSSSKRSQQYGLLKDQKLVESPVQSSSPRLEGRAGIDIKQHPFDSDSTRQAMMNTCNGGSGGLYFSGQDREKSKKSQTVLGAGKAAVTGVFGKIRKSVG
ncbi:hypothetical protein BG004_005037, partial [Podila humilis]